MQRKLTSGLVAATLGMTCAALPAVAHHGWSGQSDKQTEVSGKVHKPVSLNGAHASMEIIAEGQVWNVTLAPPARTQAAGLTPTTLAVGDTVTIRGNRSSDPKRFEMKTVRVSSKGRNYDVYPDRIQ
jgi:hypothetical protein